MRIGIIDSGIQFSKNISVHQFVLDRRIKDVLDIPEGMEEFVEDYKIKVFDIAYLSDETINKFKSTFKHVAHFFKNRRMLENYKPLDEEIEHLEEFLDLLRIFTGDEKYIEIKDY